MNYLTLVDTGKVDIFEIPQSDDENVNLDRKYDQRNALLFLAFHKNGTLYLAKKNKEALLIKLNNSNYVVNTFMDVVSNKDMATNITMNAIISTLRNKNLLINFNCD